jgi:GT2 family glycosyltransferase
MFRKTIIISKGNLSARIISIKNKTYMAFLIQYMKNRCPKYVIKVIKKLWPAFFLYSQRDELGDLLKSYKLDNSNFNLSVLKQPIDIIVPIFNGIHFLEKLFFSIAKTEMDYCVYAVNDHSTDPQVSIYLKHLAQNDLRVILIENDENIGYVKSINKALSLVKNHVVILNTDILLPDFWLERIIAPLIQENGVASATPFTNSGTICSFPYIGRDNNVYDDLDHEALDQVFRNINPSYIELPTGVGFCMGLNKNALDDIGFFDEQVFGRGYGEENDWCQRAIKKGWKNVLVDNLFVYHQHGGSFSDGEKKQLWQQNRGSLLRKHPKYDKDIEHFFRTDPIRYKRDFLIMLAAVLAEGQSRPMIAFDHSLGGSINDSLDKLIKEKQNDGISLIVIGYDRSKEKFLLDFYYKSFKLYYIFSDISVLRTYFLIVKPESVMLDNFVKQFDSFDIISYIEDYLKEEVRYNR